MWRLCYNGALQLNFTKSELKVVSARTLKQPARRAPLLMAWDLPLNLARAELPGWCRERQAMAQQFDWLDEESPARGKSIFDHRASQ